MGTTFDWGAVERQLTDPRCGLNIAQVAVERHAHGSDASVEALRCIARDGSRRTITYGELDRATACFANVLAELGVRPGERVFSLLGRGPELHVTVLGTLRHRAVACPLFTAYGPMPVAARLTVGDARVLVTTAPLYERRVAPIRARVPALRHVLVTGLSPGEAAPSGTIDLNAVAARGDDVHEIGPTDPDDEALVHFTSGTTGTPKGAVHVHRAVVAHQETARRALGLGPGDVFWCTADPGWVTGISYGVIAPLTLGATTVIDERDLDAERWYELLEAERVAVWYTAPTALRLLRRAGAALAQRHDLSALRRIACVGEPLEPAVAAWAHEAFGQAVHDTWWQTETGAIMVADQLGEQTPPGALGRPLPGITAAVLRRGDAGEVVVDDAGRAVEAPDGSSGELALRPGWPSMFQGYLGGADRYPRCFVGGWYCSGDLVRRDGHGILWFLGRADDVITSAGHLVGPLEVERALAEHPAVAEVGVIGLPDAVAGARVVAVVVVAPGVEATDALRRDLLGFGRQRLGPALAPRAISFRSTLVHTLSGKVARQALRARELGEDRAMGEET